MACNTLRFNKVAQTNGNFIEYNIFKPEIVCRNNFLIMHLYNDSIKKDLYEFNFINMKWRRLKHNLSNNYEYYSLLMLGQKFMVVHALCEDTKYHTYIGDVTQSPIAFKRIGTLQMSINEEYGHRIVTDGIFLYLLSGHCVINSIRTSVRRLNPSNGDWEMLYEPTRYRRRPLDMMIVALNSKLAVYFDSRIYVFPDDPIHDIRDFTRVNEFNLRSKTWRLVSLLPDSNNESIGLPEFPTMGVGDDHSLMQCPNESRHVYLIMGHIRLTPEWDVWRLDLTTLQWCRLQTHGPPAELFLRPVFTILPSGKMCGIRLISTGNIIRRYWQPQGPTVYRVSSHSHDPRPPAGMFYAWTRVPRLSDLCLDVLALNPKLRQH